MGVGQVSVPTPQAILPAIPTAPRLTFPDFLPLILVLLAGFFLYWLSKRLFPTHWQRLAQSAKLRMWLIILLPAQFLLIVPTIDRNLWNDFLAGTVTHDDIWDLSAGLASFGLFVWSQIIIFFADRRGNDKKAVDEEFVTRLERLLTYTRGVTKAFLNVVGEKANRIASYMKDVEDGKISVDPSVKTLVDLWDPKAQKDSLLGAVWTLVQADVGLPFWVKVTYFSRDKEYLVPDTLHDGKPRKIDTPPAEEKECYNIACSPSRSVPALCGNERKVRVVSDIDAALKDGFGPIIGCPLKKYKARSAAAIPLLEGDKLRGVIAIHTDKPNFFKDDDSAHSELQLLSDNVTERLYYEVNVDKLLALLRKGASANGKRKKNPTPAGVENGKADKDSGGRDGASAA